MSDRERVHISTKGHELIGVRDRPADQADQRAAVVTAERPRRHPSRARRWSGIRDWGPAAGVATVAVWVFNLTFLALTLLFG